MILSLDLATGRTGSVSGVAGILAAAPGGRALAVALLARSADPEQTLVIAPGLLAGSGAAMTSRFSLAFVSPLNGRLCDGSDGGPFAVALAALGCHALVISGRSETPVIVRLGPGGVELQPAADLLPLSAPERLQELEAGGAAALVCGPAAEQQVLYATLLGHDGDLPLRGGVGARCAAMNLTGISATGGPRPAAADPERFAAAAADLDRLLNASPVLCGEAGFRRWGDLALVDPAARRQLLPEKNFRARLAAPERFSAPSLLAQRGGQGGGCHDCPIACKRRDWAGRPLPRFAALTALAGCGTTLTADDVCRLFDFCAAAGIDPISFAGSVAALSEIRGSDFDCCKILALGGEMLAGDGEGALLAGGAARLAVGFGRPEAALCAQQLEIAPPDPRRLTGLLLALAVDPAGSTAHALTIGPELLRKPVPVDPAAFAGKGRIVYASQVAVAACDALGLCVYALFAAGLEEAAALVDAYTGTACSAGALEELGRRTLQQEARLLPAAAPLPERLLAEIDRQAFAAEIDRYRRIRAAAEGGA